MDLPTWLAVLTICALGAMSPGPSLAIVLQHTLQGGRPAGVVTALTHGLGVGVYAMACISGLAVVLTASSTLFHAFQWAGAAYLAWLGIKALRARPDPTPAIKESPKLSGAARDGFLIVFLNPKIAVFFIALFSQVIEPDTHWLPRLGYAMTAMGVDAGWIVALVCSNPGWLPRLQARATLLERAFGVVLLLLAASLVWEVLR